MKRILSLAILGIILFLIYSRVKLTTGITLTILGLIAYILYSKWKSFTKFKSNLIYALIASGMSRSQADNLYTKNLSLINKMHHDGQSIGNILDALGVDRDFYDLTQQAARELDYTNIIEKERSNATRVTQKITEEDLLIEKIYGKNPPIRTATLSESIQIAYDDLLLGVIPLKSITKKANELFDTQIPFSTYDLAFTIALHFFREHTNKQELFNAQLSAIIVLGDAVNDGKLNRIIAKNFQEYTYTAYHPDNMKML